MKTTNTPRYLPYIIGYILSLVFTVNAYLVVASANTGPTPMMVGLLVGLAVGQLITQIIFFIHLGREPKPRWNTLAFLLMLMVVAFIVVGSLWIMNNLNYNMMGEHTDELIIEDEGLRR